MASRRWKRDSSVELGQARHALHLGVIRAARGPQWAPSAKWQHHLARNRGDKLLTHEQGLTLPDAPSITRPVIYRIWSNVFES